MTNRMDITDAWIEETDPENERNEVCYAYFNKGGYLESLRVERPDGSYSNFNQANAEYILGTSTVRRIELVREEEMDA